MSSGNARARQKNRIYVHQLTVRESAIDGKGCFAAVFFSEGRLIASYGGEVVTREEGLRRSRLQRKKMVSAIDTNWSIDGSVGGNGTEYINHSCDPNGMTLVIDGRINILARRDIFPGEEITVDYMDNYDFLSRKCRCESECCRGKWQRKIRSK